MDGPHHEFDQHSEKQSNRARIFEHLFPGIPWDTLPLLHAKNIRTLTRIAKEFKQIEAQMSQATATNQGFAWRIDLDPPDKATIGFFIANNCTPLSERPARSLVQDLLMRDERLGGAVEKKYVAANPLLLTRPAVSDPTIFSEADIFTPVSMNILGVLNSDDQPSALLINKEGPRPPYKLKETQSVWIGSSTAVPVPSF